MLLFLAGVVTGVTVGVICMAVMTVSSAADRDAQHHLDVMHRMADDS